MNSPKVPNFTSDQIDYLNKTFPEVTAMCDNSKELYRRLGNRQVIQHIVQQHENAKRRVKV